MENEYNAKEEEKANEEWYKNALVEDYEKVKDIIAKTRQETLEAVLPPKQWYIIDDTKNKIYEKDNLISEWWDNLRSHIIEKAKELWGIEIK